MNRDGKFFEYPVMTRLLYNASVLFGTFLFVASVYALLTEPFTFGNFALGLCACVGFVLIGGGIVELVNHQTIYVDDDGISTVGPNRKVVVPWRSIDKVFYTRGEGVPAKESFVSFYITSKDDEIIKVSQYIKNFQQLGSIILEKSPAGKAEYMTFGDLLKLYYRSYFTRVKKKGNSG